MREPQLEVVVGMKKVGKTYITKEIIKRYVLSDTDTGRRSRPVLVIDVNGEYEGYKPIDFDIDNPDEYARAEQIRTITVPKAYRILPFHKNKQPMTPDEIVQTCVTVFRYFRNGLLILEDINRYMLSNLKLDVIGQLVSNRHTGTDIIIHYQGLKAIPPRIWSNANTIRMHKYTDNVDVFKDRIPNYELCKLCEIIVQDQYRKGNIRYYLWADLQEEKMIPALSNRDGFDKAFEDACIKYLSINKGQVRNMLEETDLDDVKSYNNRGDAIRSWIAERRAQYLR